MLLVVPLLLLAATPSTEQLVRSGLAAMSAGKMSEARAALESASRGAPKNPQVWLALEQMYARAGEEKPRVQAANRAIELAHAAPNWENEAGIRNFLGKVYLANAEYERALGEYREAIRLGTYEEAYRFDLAQALLGHQRFGEAIEVLEQARAVFDKSPQIELALGVAYYGQRRFPEAIGRFLRTIELAPETPQSYVFLGKILDQAGDRLPEVSRSFAAYRQANPKDYLGYLLSAKALAAERGDAREQEQLLRKAVALAESDWEAHYELGALLESVRDFGGAVKELERSVQLKPDAAAAHYHLARVYERLNEPRKAAEQRALHVRLTANEKVTAGMEPAR